MATALKESFARSNLATKKGGFIAKKGIEVAMAFDVRVERVNFLATEPREMDNCEAGRVFQMFAEDVIRSKPVRNDLDGDAIKHVTRRELFSKFGLKELSLVRIG